MNASNKLKMIRHNLESITNSLSSGISLLINDPFKAGEKDSFLELYELKVKELENELKEFKKIRER